MKHIQLQLTPIEYENLTSYLTGQGSFPAVLRRIKKKLKAANAERGQREVENTPEREEQTA